jgi:hypothetical protein
VRLNVQAKAWTYLRNKGKSNCNGKYGDSGFARMTTKTTTTATTTASANAEADSSATLRNDK